MPPARPDSAGTKAPDDAPGADPAVILQAERLWRLYEGSSSVVVLQGRRAVSASAAPLGSAAGAGVGGLG